MKSQREYYKRLLEGKKLTDVTRHSSNYIYFNAEGFLVNECGNMVGAIHADFGDWEEYEESEKIQELKKHNRGRCELMVRKINEIVRAVNKMKEEK